MSLFQYDSELRRDYAVFCGVDEAGRGPLAGDVYAAAVIFDDGIIIDGINDSKKLTEKKREQLFDEIISKAKAYCIATASVEEIEQLNILGATMLAMRRAVEGLGINVDLAVVDGNRKPEMPCTVQTLVKGDGISASVAAASILAKVSRDRYMKAVAEEYPQYQFERHKGYGTKLHNELILEHGPSPVHRMSFLKKLYAKQNDS
ncbi:MAG: ribonuclease HII [Oscillospiraceae bacterium]|nr:ribonuclease HII [Oscillospiraceae bacterium]